MEVGFPTPGRSVGTVVNFLTSPAGGALVSAGVQYVRRGAKRMRPLPEGDATTTVTQDNGYRRAVVRKVVSGRKKFDLSKLVRSQVNYTEQCLGIQSEAGVWSRKHPVSEYNPGTPGYIPLSHHTAFNTCPMRVFDLNYYVGNTNDDTYAAGSYETTNQCEDINSRQWYWKTNNTFGTDPGFRWYINEPRTQRQLYNPSVKVYRKGISIDYMLYGCVKQATEFDIRVIRITDPKMCPDYEHSLTSGSDELKEFQQNWQNLIRAWMINPVLKDIEPGPKPVKRWFKTIAKKRVRLGEQTSNIESVPTAQGKIYVRLNEVNDYSWTLKDFSVESGNAAYDAVPNVDDNGSNDGFKHLPYYTSRYYLVVRALQPVDTTASGSGGQDGTATESPVLGASAAFDYTPSMDVAIRTHFLTINGY